MSLEVQAMRWLWLEKGCHYILRERCPRWGVGEPDVLGITKDRYYIEIEIKRSYSDYLADFKKRHRISREFYIKQAPKFFYYLAEKELSEKMIPKLPEWAGLLSLEHLGIKSLKSAPANKFSEKVSLRECVRITRQMVNYTMALELKMDSHMSSWKQGRYYDYAPMKGDFQI